MASPCKIRKESQESKLTSTPQRFSMVDVPSPNLSRIARSDSSKSSDSHIQRSPQASLFGSFKALSVAENQQEPSVAGSRSSEASENGSVQTQRQGYQDKRGMSVCSTIVSRLSEHSFQLKSGLNYDEYFSECPKIKRNILIWRTYQPLEEDTLYSKILTSPEVTEDHVIEFMQTYSFSPKDASAVYHLIKLCLDLCGYQRFDLAKHYSLAVENKSESYTKIFAAMEKEDCPAEVLKTQRFLFVEADHIRYVHFLKMGIYNFFHKLILKAAEKGYLYLPTFRIFFKFVDQMINHKVRPVVHTGMIIAMKILTALCVTNYENMQYSENPTVPLLNDQKYKCVQKYMDIFYFKIKSVILKTYEKSELVKIAGANEMVVWIEHFPDVFINQYDCLDMVLRKLIQDENKKVRAAALDAFKKLILMSHLTDYKQIPDLFLVVENRFYDIDSSVTLTALDTYTAAVKSRPSKISQNTFRLLVKMVFQKNYLYAKGAALCITEVIRKSSVPGESRVLMTIVKMAMQGTHIPLLVEAFIECLPELTNWNLLVTTLSSGSAPLDSLIVLSGIFAEAVQQTLEGVSTTPREFSRKVKQVKPENHDEIAQVILPVAKDLISKYHDCPAIIKYLLKIVALINLDEDYMETYLEMVELSNRIIAVNSNKELLDIASQLLLKLWSNDIDPEGINSFLNWNIKKFKESVDSPRHSMTIVTKTAILFSRFDLRINGIQWESICDNLDSYSVEVADNLMSCCKWYVIWCVKNSDTTKEEICKILYYRDSYLKELKNALKQTSHQIVAFNQLAEFSVNFTDEVVELSKMNKIFEQLKIEPQENEDISDLEELACRLIEIVIANKKLSLDDRKKCVRNFITLIFYTILPAQCLSIVFKHFNSRYDEYGIVIQSAIEKLADDEPLTLAIVVVHTLSTVYKMLLQKHGVFHSESVEARKLLKALIERFAACKEVQSPKVAGYILYISLNFVLKDLPDHLPFLSFMACFIEFVHNEKKLVEIYDRLKDKMPKRDQKDSSVLYFAKHIRQKIKGGDEVDTSLVPNTSTGENKKAKKTAKKVKGGVNKENVQPKKKTRRGRKQYSESEDESDVAMTIHDTDSDMSQQ